MRTVHPLAQRPPLPVSTAIRAEARCAWQVLRLLVRGRIRQPAYQVGRRLSFADGTTATVYRETVIDAVAPADPAALIVTFTLRGVRGARMHRLFRAESELNTVLFAGFPGLVSKLWCAHDENGAYRGVYDWDGAALAESYVRALWRVLALVSVRGSIHYRILAGISREQLLSDPQCVRPGRPGDEGWWRPVAPTSPPA